MKKQWTKIAIALGPVMIIAAVAWEFARTNPDYNFLVEPWAIRGYDTDHGVVYAVLGILLLIGGMLASWERALQNTVSAGVTAYFVVAATIYAFVFAEGSTTLEMTTVKNVILSFLIASSVSLALRSLLGDRIGLFKRALPVGLVLFALFIVIFHISIIGLVIVVRPWVMVLFGFLMMSGLSVAIKPMNMAANRMLIVASVAGWGVILLSAGALRETLIRVQSETVQSNGATGVSAQYKDTQAALGWWLAGFGATVLFIGAVGLWAKRRDIVAAIARARKQRAAAEVSAREIQEAAEAYAAELAAKNQP